MENIVYSNITQYQFDFDTLAIMPVPNLAEIGIEITPLPETQGQWWSELEYKHISKKPGIYAIVNMINRHFYIGSAVSLYKRRNQHFNDLKANRHRNDHLQKAYNRYGDNAFRFYIIECIEVVEDLIEREQHHIDALDPHYNIARTAGSQLGMKHSEETRRKLSEVHKGKPSSRRGKPVSEEQKAKQSEALKGRKVSPKTLAKREATNRAKREANAPIALPEGHKTNLSKSPTEATRAKISATLTGYKHTEEARKNMSESHKGNINAKGYKYTEEERKNRSELLKGNTRARGNKGKQKSPESINKRTATRKAKREADPTYSKRSKNRHHDYTN